MRKFNTKSVIPALFVVGSLGLGTAVVAAKSIFTLRDGSKTYIVFYRGGAKFTKGSAASLKVGAKVSVTGNLVESKTLIHATSIKA